MKISCWCHQFRRGDITALVNSLTLGVIYVLTEKFNVFPSNTVASELSPVLDSQGMLVKDDAEDEQKISEIREELKSDMTLEMLYLLVTDGCNLRCSYCFEETPPIGARKFRAVQMTRETAMRAVDLFVAMTARYGNPEKKKMIHFYGGEPLVNRRAVHETASYVEELRMRGILPTNCHMAIVTNGVLLKEDDARLFAKHNITVGLSIDGPAWITDSYRIPKKSGVRVTERVIEAFRLLKRHGVKVGLSVTLTPKAIAHFDEVLDFFSEGELSAAEGLSLDLLHHTPNLKLSDEYFRIGAECQIKGFERFREVGLYEERVMRKVRAFIDQQPMYADCGVVGRQLVIAPDGRIGVCQDFIKPRTYFPRSVYDTGHQNLLEELFEGWRERSPFFMSQCLDCPALGICGGGCPASAELKTGSRWNLDERACHHSKRILEWLVWDAYSKLSR